MATKLCGTCRFWGKVEDSREYQTGEFRQCGAVIFDEEFQTDPNNDKPQDVAFRRTHLAVVQDGSGYHAALKTREDFGCVLHEEAGK